MPSATANAPNLTGYFKLDGTRAITGPVVITAAMMPSIASDMYGLKHVVTLTTNPASPTPGAYFTTYGQSVAITQPADGTLGTLYALQSLVTLNGRFNNAYGAYRSTQSVSAAAASDMSADYSYTTHIGTGLLNYLEASQRYTYVTGPTLEHYGDYLSVDSRGTTGKLYGNQILAVHRTAAISTEFVGSNINVQLISGSVPALVGLKVAVTGAGSVSTNVLQTSGGSHVFGGAVAITPASNVVGLQVSGSSLTAANAQLLVSLSQTWNTSGTPTALFLDITNTASNANSKLISLRANGAERFGVRADGTVFIPSGFYAGSNTAATTTYLAGSSTIFSNQGTGSTFVRFTHNNANVAFDLKTNGDLILQQIAGNVAIGTTTAAVKLDVVGTTAAQFRLRNVITDVTTKTGQVQVGHYNNAEEDFALLGGVSAFGVNTLNLGGGSSALNTATSIILYTAANAITLTGTARLTLDSAGLFTVWDGGNFALGTTTGTKIGTATTQKLGFWNATPVVRPVLATGAGATADNIITVLQNLGLVGQT